MGGSAEGPSFESPRPEQVGPEADPNIPGSGTFVPPGLLPIETINPELAQVIQSLRDVRQDFRASSREVLDPELRQERILKEGRQQRISASNILARTGQAGSISGIGAAAGAEGAGIRAGQDKALSDLIRVTGVDAQLLGGIGQGLLEGQEGFSKFQDQILSAQAAANKANASNQSGLFGALGQFGGAFAGTLLGKPEGGGQTGDLGDGGAQPSGKGDTVSSSSPSGDVGSGQRSFAQRRDLGGGGFV